MQQNNITEIEKDEIENETNGYITNPFSTKDIKITNQVFALPSLVNRLEHNEIDLNPDFQRHGNLWSATNMSRLIESVLLKLPLPIFYFDVSNPDKWIVVDGLQRLSTIKKFMVDKTLKLKNLEFLKELEGKGYDDLDRGFKRVFEGTQIVTYQIEAQTPKKVRYSIFNRINTGGLPLNAQEIRQALNQQGFGVKFLIEVTEDKIFKELFENSYNVFPYSNMGEFLDAAMEKLDIIDNKEELETLKKDLSDTLIFSEEVLGKEHRFSRAIALDVKTKTLNRSLFDVLTVCFSNIQDKELFLKNKDIFISKLEKLLQDEKGEFSKAITEGTSGKGAIMARFKIMNELIKEVLNEHK